MYLMQAEYCTSVSTVSYSPYWHATVRTCKVDGMGGCGHALIIINLAFFKRLVPRLLLFTVLMVLSTIYLPLYGLTCSVPQ
jgi:hypothetical protein